MVLHAIRCRRQRYLASVFVVCSFCEYYFAWWLGTPSVILSGIDYRVPLTVNRPVFRCYATALVIFLDTVNHEVTLHVQAQCWLLNPVAFDQRPRRRTIECF